MEKKVIVIEEQVKETFEAKMNEAVNNGYIPCGHPAIAFENGSFREVARFVVVMIKFNEKVTTTLL